MSLEWVCFEFLKSTNPLFCVTALGVSNYRFSAKQLGLCLSFEKKKIEPVTSTTGFIGS